MFYKLYVVFMTHLGIRSPVVAKVQKVQYKCKRALRVQYGGNRLCTLFFISRIMFIGLLRHMYITLLHVWGCVLVAVLFALLLLSLVGYVQQSLVALYRYSHLRFVNALELGSNCL